jgi:isoquinoline 1-oxidoreductase
MEQETHMVEPERYEFSEKPRYTFSLSRRAFVQVVGAGLLITSAGGISFAQRRSAQNSPGVSRFHIDADGMVTVYTGKVEVGQGARTQIGQAAAEELHVPLEQVKLVMGDTDQVPDDGGTYGSQTTPRTIPTVRNAAAAARELLVELACNHWGAKTDGAEVENGVITHSSGKTLTLAELVTSIADVNSALSQAEPGDEKLTPPDAWKTLGQPLIKTDARAIAMGEHRYPSDIKRPGMVYGKILRPPSYGAKLVRVDLDSVNAIDGATAVRDGDFAGVTAATSFLAQQALDKLAATAEWERAPHPSSADLFTYLKLESQGADRHRAREETAGDVDSAFASAKQTVQGTYNVSYIQHAPMEPRAAVAEWDAGKLTVWTGTQVPFGVREELAIAFSIPEEKVRVIQPDCGGGFGGKHRGDAAVEAARLAKAVEKPVAVLWTREEEFTWAYFRPAGVLEIAAALDEDGSVTAWDIKNFNSGMAAIGCPYAFPHQRIRFQPCQSPLREGSYRALAAPANNFAREAFIDRIVAAVGEDPLEFRLKYLGGSVLGERLRHVLMAAAESFGWATRNRGSACGLACGTEKGSYVATCAEVVVDSEANKIEVKRICVAFECGAIQNPKNLRAQVEGCAIMALGGALSEAIEFENGAILNPRFKDYEVPRFKDVPPIEVILVNRPDLPSVGAGETPMIAVAPAIANAMFAATGTPPEVLPLRRALA